MKKNKLKYLSKSMLLEEEGLPQINVILALTISITVLLFILWANFMEVKDIVNTKGILNTVDNEDYEALLVVPNDKVVDISIGNLVYVNVPGVTKKDSIIGVVSNVKNEEINNSISYIAIIELDLNYRQEELMNLITYDKIEVSGEIITGKRSIMKYILGPLWEIGERAAAN